MWAWALHSFARPIWCAFFRLSTYWLSIVVRFLRFFVLFVFLAFYRLVGSLQFTLLSDNCWVIALGIFFCGAVCIQDTMLTNAIVPCHLLSSLAMSMFIDLKQSQQIIQTTSFPSDCCISCKKSAKFASHRRTNGQRQNTRKMEKYLKNLFWYFDFGLSVAF